MMPLVGQSPQLTRELMKARLAIETWRGMANGPEKVVDTDKRSQLALLRPVCSNVLH